MKIKAYRFPGVYLFVDEEGNKKIATKNLVPGQRVYGERLVKFEGEEYRVWNPRRSKLAAAILNGLENFPIRPGSRVLYLGVASGTTAPTSATLWAGTGRCSVSSSRRGS